MVSLFTSRMIRKRRRQEGDRYFSEVVREEDSIDMALIASVAIDIDFALSWVYYDDKLKDDDVSQHLKSLLLAFNIIGTIAWIFIATDGYLYEGCLWVLTKLVCCIQMTIACVCKGHPSIEEWNWQRIVISPRPFYSPGWFVLAGVVFADIAQLVLTTLIDASEEEVDGPLSALGVANLTSSAYDLLVKLAEACHALKTTRKLLPFLEEEFAHKTGYVTSALQLSSDKFITASMDYIKVWKINRGKSPCCEKKRFPPIQVQGARFGCIAKLDEDGILVGLTGSPYVMAYNVDSGAQRAPSVEDPESLPLDIIMTLVPFDDARWIAAGGSVVLWQQAEGMIRAEKMFMADSGRVNCAAKYDDNTLIGGTDEGKVVVWRIDDPDQRVSFDTNDPNTLAVVGVDFVACLERRENANRIVTRADNAICVWDIIVNVNEGLIEHTLVRSMSGSAVAIDTTGRVIVGSEDGHVFVYDSMEREGFQLKFKTHDRKVLSIAALTDGRILTGAGRMARLWKPDYTEVSSVNATHSRAEPPQREDEYDECRF